MKAKCHQARESYCRELCKACYERERLQNNPHAREVRRAFSKRYYARNRDKLRAYHRAYYNGERRKKYELKRRYGLSLEEYNALVRAQSGKCILCEKVQRRFHVDHDHDTGGVRGLLCTRCNTGIAILEDAERRTKAMTYLGL